DITALYTSQLESPDRREPGLAPESRAALARKDILLTFQS
ncbi:uncharacterized, partial [Tachysurus ichikawai]